MDRLQKHSTALAAMFIILTLDLWKTNLYVSAGYGYSGKGTSSCERDGFYYQDSSSLTICSNGNQYLQHCAFGTKNREASHYGSGKKHAYSDFCSVNLNDYGAGASRKHSGGGGYQQTPNYRSYRQPTHHASGGGGHGGGGHGGGGYGGGGHGGGGYGGGGYGGGGHGGGGYGGGGYGGGGYGGGGYGGGGYGGGGHGGGGYGGGGHGGGGYGGGGHGGGGYGGGGYGGGGHGGSGLQPASQYSAAHFPAFHKTSYH